MIQDEMSDLTVVSYKIHTVYQMMTFHLLNDQYL